RALRGGREAQRDPSAQVGTLRHERDPTPERNSLPLVNTKGTRRKCRASSVPVGQEVPIMTRCLSLLLLCAPAVASAQPADPARGPAPAPPPPVVATTAPEPPPTVEAETPAPPAHWYDSLQVNGFASIAYSYNANRPTDPSNQLHVFDTDPQ